MRFLVCTSSYWLGQQSFTNLIVLCRDVIAYKFREVLKHDGVTLLCWWGNIYKFCVSDEVTSYFQSIYLTLSVIIRACLFWKIHGISYRGCINIHVLFYFKSFLLVSLPNVRITGTLETLPEFDIYIKSWVRLLPQRQICYVNTEFIS